MIDDSSDARQFPPADSAPENDSAASVSGAVARVSVLLPLPLKGAYDYAVPDGLTLVPGDFVRVPFGQREATGVVWGPGSGEVGDDRLKPVATRCDAPPLSDPHRRFINWVARYTLTAPGLVLRMSMSIPEALEPPPPDILLRRAGTVPDLRLTQARQKALDALGDAEMAGADLQRAAGVGAGVVKGLVDAGALIRVARPADAALAAPDPDAASVILSPAQAEAAGSLADAVGAGAFDAVLLDGVTGSGKTEVYFEAVAEALRTGRQSLVLLPEIALSAQWLDRFRHRFGALPAAWHSDLSRRQRRFTWRAVAEGRVPVVVGARSALFLPFRDLGLIVVDEEHDGSYKQEEGVVYHARDMAVVRAHLGGLPIVLASATPSLETLVNIERGRYRELHLPERHGGASLPTMDLVDMRSEPPPRGRWLSPVVEAALCETLEAGEQAMLYLNRRGYAPLTLCRACGHRMQCPACTTWLVEHRLAGRLECHHCGYSTPLPEACPACGAAESLVPCGPGVERLAEEVAARFPEARLAIMSSDTVRGPEAAAALVARVQAREIDVLVGTQIMAKGHHFPLLTLVGVIDADLALSGGDLRAAERTWQMLSQVAGRAGRARHPGRVLLQSWMPEHPVLAAIAAGDREQFVEEELAAREAYHMPPFGRLVAIIVSGRDASAVDRTGRLLAARAPRAEGVQVLGPAPAPLAVLRGHHRVRLLVKAGRDARIQDTIRGWLGPLDWPSSVRVKVDIDPYSFL